MTLDLDILKGMVYDTVTARDDEMTCPECFDQLDRFVDVMLADKNAAQAMPVVKDHLDRCIVCREEFEALLYALRSMYGDTDV